jgi:hypothetical protein
MCFSVVKGSLREDESHTRQGESGSRAIASSSRRGRRGRSGPGGGVLAGCGNRAEAEARDRGGAGVWTHLESAEGLGGRGGLVAKPEDEDAGLDLFGRKQAKPAGLPPEFHLCGGRGGESNIGQSLRKRGIACLIKGGKPVVEEVAGGCVGDEAQLGAQARKANENGGVNGADVGSGASGHRSVGRIADNDGVDLVWIVIVFLAHTSSVTHGIEDQGERTDGDNDSEQDGTGAERLAAGDIEGGSGEWVVVLRLSRGEPDWRRSGGVGHTDSVDALSLCFPGRTEDKVNPHSILSKLCFLKAPVPTED